MKTKLFTLMLALASLAVTAQEKCLFYIDRGAKEVKALKCGTFNDLKVKVPIPKNAVDFDLVRVTYSSTGGSHTAEVSYTGAGPIKMVAGTTKELWISNPDSKEGKEDRRGDFKFNFVSDASYVSMDNLCKYPRENKFESVTINISAYGHTKTGTEQYYSEASKSWKSKITYADGTLLSTGSIEISQQELEKFYSDKNIKIVYPDPKISAVETHEDETGSGTYPNNEYKVIKYSQTILTMYKENKKSKDITTMIFNIINESVIENLATYKKAKANNPNYTPLQYIKDASDNWYMYSACGCAALDDLKKAKYNTEISIGSLIPYGFVEELKKGRTTSNDLMKKKETNDLFTLWTQKTIGKNVYECAHVDKVFKANCNTGKLEYNPSVFEVVDFYVIYKKPNVIIIRTETYGNSVYGQYYDEPKQKGYINSVLENLELP